MKTNTNFMQPEYYYHIYNRGINGETLFKQERNFDYFLQQYAKYIEPIATTYAYVLMGNHFHFLIRIKEEKTIRQNLSAQDDKRTEWIVSNQFAKLFNSYAQAINKQEKRTGALFEEAFRRKPVGTEGYAAQVVYYIHHNPQKHKFVTDFKTYPHSSYPAFVRQGQTRIPREEVFDWFGGRAFFLAYHQDSRGFDEAWFEACWIEGD
ncbi:MAG: transposase [Saprospiraceae bacterium]|nr:transposase [Saprospiraceae bacterium]